MNLFFGKISKKIDKQQLEEGYYRADKNSSWFNGIQPGDYAYIIGGGKIQLWKAKEWSQKYNGDVLLFDIIHENLGIMTIKLNAIKYFKITIELTVYAVRSTGSIKKAFFPIEFDKRFTEEMLINIKTYQDKSTYRKLHILSKEEIPNSESEDIQLYKEGRKWRLFPASFICSEFITRFRDNTKMKGGGKIRKDNTIQFITLPQNTGKYFAIDNIKISILSLYDLFCCEYKEDPDIGEEFEDNDMEENYNLNRILYGPPGTGKTYSLIEKALEIIDGEVSNNREDAKQRFEELKDQGQIEFITFHQSYGYEEFIEGIRADINDEHLRYSLEDGVFKSICNRAKVIKSEKTYNINKDVDIWKISLGDTQNNDENHIFDYCIKHGKILLSFGNGLDFSGCNDRLEIAKKMKDFKEFSYPPTAVNTFKNKIKVGDLILVSHGNRKIRAIGKVSGEYHLEEVEDLESYIQARDVEWLMITSENPLPYYKVLTKQISQMTLYNIKSSVNIMDLQTILSGNQSVQKDKNYVLIIDEINRGNISKIFGELITLIEPSKRVGNEEALTVKLPYSNEVFGVPNNLYIIGTMNTADRSIALMDTALRRRFHFEEMMPKPELLDEIKIEGIDLKEMLTTMNQRIEYLYDRDHTLGHSYFMELGKEITIEQLESIFKNKILPLLEEYFYGDWSKIRLVFGDNQKSEKDQFIQENKKIDPKALFGDVSEQFDDEQISYQINDEAFDRIESYLGIYKR